jgi:hypothetical protein
MALETLSKVLLVVHLLALATAMGITLANYVMFRQFWRLLALNKEQGLAAFRAISTLQIFGIVGLLLLILTGIGMLAIYQWTFISLLWFQVKLVLVALLFVNGFSLGRTQSLKLQSLLSSEPASQQPQPDIALLNRNFRIFQLTQLTIFGLIIIASVFRFI